MLYDNVKRTACGDNLNGILQPACHILATLCANLLSFIFNIFDFFFCSQNRKQMPNACMQASSIDFISLTRRRKKKQKSRSSFTEICERMHENNKEKEKNGSKHGEATFVNLISHRNSSFGFVKKKNVTVVSRMESIIIILCATVSMRDSYRCGLFS